MNPIKRVGRWLGGKFEAWLQKVAAENRPIEHDYDHLPLDDHSEDDFLMGIERDEADPKLWR